MTTRIPSVERDEVHEVIMKRLVSEFDKMLGTKPNKRYKLKHNQGARKEFWDSISDQDKERLKLTVYDSVLSHDEKGKPRKMITMSVLHSVFIIACRRWKG